MFRVDGDQDLCRVEGAVSSSERTLCVKSGQELRRVDSVCQLCRTLDDNDFALWVTV